VPDRRNGEHHRVVVRTASPLIELSIFRIRPFPVENLVLGVSMLVFVPVFFKAVATIVAFVGLRPGLQQEAEATEAEEALA
jgi:predicted membrane protein